MNKTPRLAQIISVGPPGPYGHRLEVKLYSDNWTWEGRPAPLIPPHEERMFRLSKRNHTKILNTDDVVSIVINGITVTNVKLINHGILGSAIIEWYLHHRNPSRIGCPSEF